MTLFRERWVRVLEEEDWNQCTEQDDSVRCSRGMLFKVNMCVLSNYGLANAHLHQQHFLHFHLPIYATSRSIHVCSCKFHAKYVSKIVQ